MLGGQEDPSKTEEATPKKVEKQREEGNVPKSQELSKFISIAAAMIIIPFWIGNMGIEIKNVFTRYIGGSPNFSASPQEVIDVFTAVSYSLAIIVLPVLLFLAFASLMTMRLQVGQLWTLKVFKFKGERFNIPKALKQMFFSPQTIIRLLKSVALALVVSVVPFFIIKSEFAGFIAMFYEDAASVAVYMLEMGYYMVACTLIPMGIVAITDLVHTRFTYKEKMKMTKHEVKDERKQMEGDPLIKQKQRQKMMEAMAKRMFQDVPKADVVITNPTHIAIAISYNAKDAPAPMVLAKGVDHVAEKIKDIARENNIPIRENVPLARALYKAVEIGEMIPQDLYKATASILAGIWRMQGKMPKR